MRPLYHQPSLLIGNFKTSEFPLLSKPPFMPEVLSLLVSKELGKGRVKVSSSEGEGLKWGGPRPRATPRGGVGVVVS